MKIKALCILAIIKTISTYTIDLDTANSIYPNKGTLLFCQLTSGEKFVSLYNNPSMNIPKAAFNDNYYSNLKEMKDCVVPILNKIMTNNKSNYTNISDHLLKNKKVPRYIKNTAIKIVENNPNLFYHDTKITSEDTKNITAEETKTIANRKTQVYQKLKPICSEIKINQIPEMTDHNAMDEFFNFKGIPTDLRKSIAKSITEWKKAVDSKDLNFTIINDNQKITEETMQINSSPSNQNYIHFEWSDETVQAAKNYLKQIEAK